MEICNSLGGQLKPWKDISGWLTSPNFPLAKTNHMAKTQAKGREMYSTQGGGREGIVFAK